MFWVIRWSADGADKAAVVEAATRAAAECWALKRDIPVVIVCEAEPEDVRAARPAKRIWTYTPHRGHRCFGRPVSGFHLVCFMIAGMLTATIHLARAFPGHTPHLW